MPDESEGNARRQFSRDLQQIREDRGVTIAQIHENTQISKAQIEAFESGSLFEQESMNQVYLRAFVRAYAETLEIRTDLVLDQLDRVLDGSYENELAVEFLGVPPSVAEEENLGPDPDDSGDGADVEDHEPDATSPSAPGSSTEEDAPVDDETGDREDAASVEPEESQRDSGSVPDWLHEEKEEGAQGASTATASTEPTGSTEFESRSRADARGEPVSAPSTAVRLWRTHRGEVIVASLALVVVLGGIGVGTLLFNDDAEQSAGNEEVAATAGAAPSGSDSLETQRPSRPLADLTLGDTMHVTVYAEGIVQRMRAQQDDDLRRPYWIEKGEARVFPFTERLMLRDRLDSVRVYFEGYPYPTTRTDEEGRIVIDRETAQSIVDTLRGDPARIPVEPDTIEIRVPPEGDTE